MILVRNNKSYGCGKNKVLREHGTGEAQSDWEGWSRTAFKGQVIRKGERTGQVKVKSVVKYRSMKQAVAHGLVYGRGR